MRSGGGRLPGKRKKSPPVETRKDRAESRSLQSGLPATSDARRASTAMAPQVTAERRRKPRETEERDPLKNARSTILSELDLGRLMKTILDQALRLLNAERGVLFMGGPDSAGFVPVMAVNLHGEHLLAIDRLSRTILDLGKSGHKVITEDALSDPRFVSAASVRRNKMRSIMCAPLVSPHGQVGAIYLDAPNSNAFPSESVGLLEALAESAALALENARRHGEVVRENARMRASTSPSSPLDRIVWASARMKALRLQVASVALMNQSVVIIGEPGTGRSLLARVIHDASQRAAMAFVVCDCSALRDHLLAGALVGRAGVAVRGAYGLEPGLVRQADRGTLYLTHAESLEDSLAGVLSKIAERGIFRPLGGRRDERVDVRLILATVLDPGVSGERALLPKALSGRLQELQLLIPPLRERPEDIPILALDFMRASAESGDGRTTTTFTPAAIKLLQQQLWPGNVRELHQVLRRIMLFHAQPVIDDGQVREALASIESDGGNDLGPWSGKTLQLRDWEKEAIRQALLKANGNKAEAARMLGIHRNTLVLKIKAMGLPK
jgi:DNA-binding NtrC family response regulator